MGMLVHKASLLPGAQGGEGDEWVSFLNFAAPSHLWVAQLTHPFPSSKDQAHWLKLDLPCPSEGETNW